MSSELEGSGLSLGIFVRAPRPGFTKTRLAPALGDAGAARLYEAFLTDTLARFETATLFYASADDAGWLAARYPDRRREPQPDGDLGERMSAALGRLREGAPTAAIIGSDVPTLAASRVAAAARALASADVVLGPATDGGFYLIGCRGAPPSLDAEIRWSTRHALADTVKALGERTVRLLRPHYDVDTPDDLRLLRAHLSLSAAAAPYTAQALFDRGGGA